LNYKKISIANQKKHITHFLFPFSFQKKKLLSKYNTPIAKTNKEKTIKALILFVKHTNPNLLIHQTFLTTEEEFFLGGERFCIRRQDFFVHNAFLMNLFFLSSSSSSSCTQDILFVAFTEMDFALCLQLLLHSANTNKKKHKKKLVIKKLLLFSTKKKNTFFLLQKSNPFLFLCQKKWKLKFFRCKR